ncbi:SDR family NAD(P)-dependent oxidoreductase [Paraburkholderia tropica]|uniref:NAD(P)-dependent dehydrogenase (Short-subunit alcohol dehydrogenase family) n=1 Tax=Paraburkholderia tropica TaxID=92647 RepID=A0ABX5MQ06_9BURK|nr:SDR family oxidoreductase [Paraburkholderia tropica]MBB3000511.1 NAD(P)-dependent dehydrogenase (short-subunit alcohol dehydrogenase family) [Paraburkholderia tropica]MBB6320140.1 NAD(P)-dependent dehydrogenase (short-subunit alcohol dehydrogenase family) [Paraburkholderia tropica]PXX16851.1 NAD(P)-dependent dehydrogenase (short-subunit alcohol dehydrogenase family) [Paraburkholderia tropica]PZW84006.1 NAD(P)-dependent dehydrogenase (short-subunit alcohol dehydrogenase family) [Paraburkholde
MSKPENWMSWLGLSGQVCVITGGAGGIGSETARQVATAGGKVAILDRDMECCAEILNDIRLAGGSGIAVCCDVSDAVSVTHAAETVCHELGPAQILVNNAGVGGGGRVDLLDASVDEWQRQLSINLTGAFLCAQAFGTQMRDAGRGGTMVHVASIGGSIAIPKSVAYSVSKAGLLMLSRQLCLELAQFGIRSNCVSPGLVRTPMSESYYEDENLVRARREAVPSRRIASPKDMAEAILFLASNRSGYVNGEDILIDGGLSQIVMASIPRV